MKLWEAIDLYIHRRRAVGAYLHGPETILRSVLHHYGDLELHRIRTSHITQFLNGRRGVRGVRTRTCRGKYGALKLFFADWCLRGRLRQSPVPLTAPKPPQDFIPYIYSHAVLQRLLKALPECQRCSVCLITALTFRALLLVLYGTGMRLGEALGLRIADVDLAQDLIRIRESKFYKTRLVPIGKDVHRVIENYLSSPFLQVCHNSLSHFWSSLQRGKLSALGFRQSAIDCLHQHRLGLLHTRDGGFNIARAPESSWKLFTKSGSGKYFSECS